MVPMEEWGLDEKMTIFRFRYQYCYSAKKKISTFECEKRGVLNWYIFDKEYLLRDDFFPSDS